jgi:DNA polymerase III delta prime subunit
LDEADYLSQNAQAILRGLMEQYADNARFILTCNFVHKIITPLKSRCHSIRIDKTDPDEFMKRAINVLLSEGFDIDEDQLLVLDSIIKATYPDLRKCLRTLQGRGYTGRLTMSASVQDEGALEWRLDAVRLFKEKRYADARKLICSQTTPEEIDDVFRWMYDNLNLFSDTQEGQDTAVQLIRDGMVSHGQVMDTEINLAATLIKLSSIGE